MSIDPSTAPYRTAHVRGADGLYYKIGGGTGGGDGLTEAEADALFLKPSEILAGANVSVSTAAGAVTISATGGGGTAVAAGVALVVAASTASAKIKAGADYVCDGTADNVEIQAAIDAVRVTGGVVQLSPGNFAIAATVNLLGNDTGASASLHTIDLRGSGAQTTTFNVANNVNGIEIAHWAQVNIQDLGIYIQGSGIGIHSTSNTTTDTRSFWHSTFRNIRITGAYATAATGWAMWLDMPWRSVFENIEVEGTRNGIMITNNSTVQNAGDCTFTRMFVEIAGDNGYALYFDSISDNMNQNNWSMFEAGSNGGAGTTGIYLGGAYYGGTASQRFWGLNLEQFQTCINVANGTTNVFDCNYLTGKSGDPLNRMFVCGSATFGNTFSSKYVNVNSNGTLKLIDDAGTSAKYPNVFEDIRVENNPGANVTVTKTAYTVIRDISSIDVGTIQAGITGVTQSRGTVVGPAATTAMASLRLPPGTAPSTPADGDLWSTPTGFYGKTAAGLVGPFGTGGGGTTYTPLNLVVASSTASTGVKASAYAVCDGTADDVEIQAALNAVKAEGGGIVQLTEGTYNITTGLTIAGTDLYSGVTQGLVGVGMHSTKLVCATGIHGISLTATASVIIRDMEIAVAGAGSGIVSARGNATMMRGFWNSEFTNLYFSKNGGAAHTGWAMNLGAPFRSTFKNLEIFWLHNGIRLYTQDAGFNPGDCTFERIFIELDDVTGSVGLKLESPVNLGLMNQNVFTMCEFIDSGTAGTAIQFAGAGKWDSGGAWNFFTGINIEQFAILVDVQYGNGNRFDFNYIEASAGGTYFKFGSAANGNHVRSVGMLAVGSSTATVINDANSDISSPNMFDDMYVGVDTGGAANATVTSATQVRGTRGYNDGTLAASLAFQKFPFPHLRVPVLGADPAAASLVNGDMWVVGTALKVRLNGVTKTVTVT